MKDNNLISNQSIIPKSNPLSSYEPREIEWLWQDRIPIGCVTLLEGDGGVGKSSIIAALGAAVSAGRALQNDIARSPRGVLLLAAEDDPSVVLRPRFEANAANLDLVRCYDQTMLLNKAGLELLEKEIFEHSIGLIVIDPIVSFLGQSIDTSKATDVRSVMGPLHLIAQKHACAIIVVRHWNKSTLGTASQRGSGSVDFRNAARSVLQVIKGDECHYLTLEKSNYGATGKSLTFSIDGKIVRWTGTSDMSADEILKERQHSNGEDKSELSEAMQFLEDELSAGPVASSTLQRNAKDCGISDSTLKRARSKLKVTSKKLPGKNCFYSYLPHQIPDDTQDQAHEAHLPTRELHEPHPDQLSMECDA